MEIQPYGTMIAIGIVVSGAVGRYLSKRFALDFNNMILLFAYGLSFGFVGAKCMYLLLNFQKISWSSCRLSEIIADGGFVFYGGLPLGALGILLAQGIHDIELKRYLPICVPLLPLGHAFGRIGCHFAGCCYGIAYDGPFAVVYHNSPITPSETPLFPVQLLEAALLILLSGILLTALLKGLRLGSLFTLYFGGYSSLRFSLEFLRGDAERGIAAGLSTSQWISLIILALLLVLHTIYRHRENSMKKAIYFVLMALSLLAVAACCLRNKLTSVLPQKRTNDRQDEV